MSGFVSPKQSRPYSHTSFVILRFSPFRLAQKAFFPGPVPFPLLHIDSLWKFQEMIKFRDSFCKKNNLELIVHYNREGKKAGVGPFTHGSRKHTDIMKTYALLQAETPCYPLPKY